ncbi:MAG: hypothetical protein NTY36_03460 [Deltaproteobacteria bacterium]|nr:hypothetical protein [Deltaproteobacteria bacterium]
MSWKNLKKLTRAAVCYVRHPVGVTCLDCGFLTLGRKEVTTADRMRLHATSDRGGPADLPPVEEIWCFRSLWIEYDLIYAGPSIEGIFDELQRQRRDCEGFLRYRPGWSPTGHQDLLLKGIERKEKILFVMFGWVLGVLGTLLVKFFGLY